MHTFSKNLLRSLLWLGLTRAGFACDSCALYIATDEPRPGFTFATTGQITRMGSVWDGDTEQPNSVGQHLDSAITQFTVGYNAGGRWRAQFTAPYVRRSYLRPDHALIETGRESGWGDATLAVRYEAWRRETETDSFTFAVVGGVKFATGDATHLGDEIGHHHHHHPDFPDSGVHGHDLALGSGSTDLLLGGDAGWKRGRFFVRGSLQYDLRRPGAFDYRIADEVSWEAGPGWQILRNPAHSLSVQALFSTEHKGLDTLAGVAQGDTGFSARYLGLRVAGTWRDRFSLEASLEKPVRLRTSELQVVPDSRLRWSVMWRF